MSYYIFSCLIILPILPFIFALGMGRLAKNGIKYYVVKRLGTNSESLSKEVFYQLFLGQVTLFYLLITLSDIGISNATDVVLVGWAVIPIFVQMTYFHFDKRLFAYFTAEKSLNYLTIAMVVGAFLGLLFFMWRWFLDKRELQS